MAKKSKKKKPVKVDKNSSEINHLQALINASLKAAESKTSPLIDDLFLYQASRLEEQIKKLKGNQ